MTLLELCRYLGYMPSDQVIEHIAAKRLPAAERGFGIMDKAARWDVGQVDVALNEASKSKTPQRT